MRWWPWACSLASCLLSLPEWVHAAVSDALSPVSKAFSGLSHAVARWPTFLQGVRPTPQKFHYPEVCTEVLARLLSSLVYCLSRGSLCVSGSHSLLWVGTPVILDRDPPVCPYVNFLPLQDPVSSRSRILRSQEWRPQPKPLGFGWWQKSLHLITTFSHLLPLQDTLPVFHHSTLIFFYCGITTIIYFLLIFHNWVSYIDLYPLCPSSFLRQINSQSIL